MKLEVIEAYRVGKTRYFNKKDAIRAIQRRIILQHINKYAQVDPVEMLLTAVEVDLSGLVKALQAAKDVAAKHR